MTTVFVVSAPSGSGKSTLVRRVLDRDRRLLFSVSFTTRAPRGEEKPGESYHYIGRKEFEERLAHNEFLEHAIVFGRDYYGTHISVLEQAKGQDMDLLLDIDVQGARQLKERIPDAVTIFILPPSRAILEKRLRARGDVEEEVLRRRLDEAASEIANSGEYDYQIVNDEDAVEESTGLLLAIIAAERARSFRMEARVRPIRESFEKEVRK
jgi:guanylate kinase